jgi:hypothetical protein
MGGMAISATGAVVGALDRVWSKWGIIVVPSV